MHPHYSITYFHTYFAMTNSNYRSIIANIAITVVVSTLKNTYPN